MPREPKTSKDDRLQEEAVHTLSPVVVPSIDGASTEEDFTKRGEISLIEKVVERENMLKALRRVEQNRGASGIDGMGVAELRSWYLEHEGELRSSILQETYRPKPVRREEIPKASGKGVRQLGIPTVVDRLIQQAILQVLQPLIDPSFSESSFGFRAGRNAHQAIEQAKKYVREGYCYVVDLDLADFFNRVNHDILMSKVARYITDKRLLRLIRRYLESGIMARGCRVRSEEGVPQGGPLSPLLSNIMLDELDKELERRGHRFCRYADDCNTYVRSQRAGERVFASITKFVETRLKLKVNREKSAVDRVSRRKFLGFSFMDETEARIRIAPESKERFKVRVRQLTSRTAGISLSVRIERLNSYLTGWTRYFSKAETPSVIANLRSWLQRRLRQCVIRQWRKGSTWWKRLVALGLSPISAATIAASSKGWWRLSLSPQLHKALGNHYWDSKGLVNITELFTRLRNAS